MNLFFQYDLHYTFLIKINYYHVYIEIQTYNIGYEMNIFNQWTNIELELSEHVDRQ